MNFHCTKINWKKSVSHFVETLCTRLSGRLRVLALISGRPPSFPPSTQPCRAPGPASVSDVVKQGLTRWWRGLPKQWPTGAASRGCRGRRRGETKGETKRRNQGLRSHLGKREEDSNAHRLCNYLQAATRRLYFFRIRFQTVPFSPSPAKRIVLCLYVSVPVFLFTRVCLSAGHVWSFHIAICPDQIKRPSQGTVRLTQLPFTHKLSWLIGAHTFKFCGCNPTEWRGF